MLRCKGGYTHSISSQLQHASISKPAETNKIVLVIFYKLLGPLSSYIVSPRLSVRAQSTHPRKSKQTKRKVVKKEGKKRRLLHWRIAKGFHRGA